MRGGQVSFVIRTLNEEKFISRCLDMLDAQVGCPTVDVVIVDSGSTDSTLRQISNRPRVSVLHVAGSDLSVFDYSMALNAGISNTSSEIVGVLSAHAVPAGAEWLATMLRWLEDEKVAAVYCRQTPWQDADPFERARVLQTFGNRRLVFGGAEADPGKLAFSNAAALIRRGLWEQCPFRLPSGEDLEWAKEMLERGFLIVYEPDAVVFHSHSESASTRARRRINLARSRDIRDGVKRRWTLTLRECVSMLLRDLRRCVQPGLSVRNRWTCAVYAAAAALWYVRHFGLCARSTPHGLAKR